MLKTGTIYGINGPVIYLKGNTGFRMSEMVYVGKQKLVGEVIALDKDLTTVQVYEETTGLRPGEEVVASGNAVSVTLAPGILNNIFDGIERPLERIAESPNCTLWYGTVVLLPSIVIVTSRALTPSSTKRSLTPACLT